MYDRKKITLFVLLIATVLLGGVSLFLATQIGNNQSPDDSLAGSYCYGRVSDNDEVCRSLDYSSCGTNSVCQWRVPASNICGGVSDGSSCEARTVGTACQKDGLNGTCNNVGTTPQAGTVCRCTTNATAQTCAIPGTSVTFAMNSTYCDPNSHKKYSCPSPGSAVADGCCTGYALVNGSCNIVNTCSGSTGDTTCQGRLPGAACQLPGGGNGSCTGSVGAACTCQATGTSGGTASCTEQGEEISHGNTACINGTNYTCTNGTATPGSSCTTDPTGGGSGGTTGGTCTPEAPTKAKLLTPLANAVVNTTTVTLSWDKNGTFGKACPTNDNKYRVKLLAVGLNEACPTSSLDLPNLAGHIEGGTGEGGLFNYQINVQDDTKYCWAIRKNNGSQVADTAVRSFTVNIEETNPTTGGGGGDDGTGTTTSEPVDPTTTTTGSNATTTTGGTVTGAVASANTALPETAIISDELDPIIVGMILVIIGLTLYKFDFGRKRELE